MKDQGELMDASSATILLIEDDPNDILFIQRAFRQANTTNPIQTVRDGDSAIAYLSGIDQYEDRDRFPLPILVLLDLKLPRRSGIEVLEWMKQRPVIRRIPVIVLTSSKESVDIERTYDLGVSSYLVKPVRFKTLVEMVRLLAAYWLNLNEHPVLFIT